jgi:myo-inositol-1(or 4)-monophosphatase
LISNHLKTLFQQVLQAVTTGDPEQWQQLGQNPKGDQVKWFDLAADQAVTTYLAEQFPYPVRLLSEEGPPREFGRGEPVFTMILDPVDGSDNFVREIWPAGTAIALVPAEQPVNVANVQFALVGNLYTGHRWQAVRGEGAFYQDRALHCPARLRLEEVILTCNMNNVSLPPRLTELLAQGKGARAFGAAAIDLALVAGGTLGAYLDLADTLTPENFLASALIITEAGGLITDPAGKPLPDIESLTECYQIVAAACPELHATLVKKLNVR